MKSALASFLGATALAAVVACGASSSKMAAAPAAPREVSAPGADSGAQSALLDPRDEITRLSDQIAADSGRLGLTAPAPMASPPAAERMSTVPMSTDASCKPAKTERCESSCKVSDSICANASRICDLAAQLTADNWAAGKCASAKQSCDSAHGKCCGCQ